MDFVRVGYFIPLNGPLNGHPPRINLNEDMSAADRIHYKSIVTGLSYVAGKDFQQTPQLEL